MTEALTIANSVVSDIEPDSCINCPKNVVQPVIDYVKERADKSDITPAECADLVLESLRRCREHNSCPRTEQNAFTARQC